MKEIFDFKLQDRGYDEYNNIKHSHEGYYEILLVHSGTGSIIVRDTIKNFQPGSIYFIDGADIHCSVPDKAEEYCRSKLIISCDFIDKLVALTDCSDMIEEVFRNKNKNYVLVDEKTVGIIYECFMEIDHALKCDDRYTKSIVSFHVIKMICTYHSQNKKEVLSRDRRIAEVLEYLNRSLSSKIDLEQISNQMHMSKYYLCHIFKKKTGMTIFEYIFLRRLSVAKNYLRTTDMSISEISVKTGFSSFSYFSKMFKISEGKTPYEYRKEHTKNAINNL